MSTKVTIKRNGSIHIEGDFELFDQEGNKFDLGGRTKIKLCRCGATKDQPFCDHTHKLIGFHTDVSARALEPLVPKPS